MAASILQAENIELRKRLNAVCEYVDMEAKCETAAGKIFYKHCYQTAKNGGTGTGLICMNPDMLHAMELFDEELSLKDNWTNFKNILIKINIGQVITIHGQAIPVNPNHYRNGEGYYLTLVAPKKTEAIDDAVPLLDTEQLYRFIMCYHEIKMDLIDWIERSASLSGLQVKLDSANHALNMAEYVMDTIADPTNEDIVLQCIFEVNEMDNAKFGHFLGKLNDLLDSPELKPNSCSDIARKQLRYFYRVDKDSAVNYIADNYFNLDISFKEFLDNFMLKTFYPELNCKNIMFYPIGAKKIVFCMK